MNEQQNDIINIPLEYKVACTIRYLKPHEVLQTFIDHISFYTTLSTAYSLGFREASDTTSEYSVTHGIEKASPAFVTCHDFARKCIMDVLRLTVKKGVSENQKRKKCIPIVKELYRVMEHIKSPAKIYLDEDTVLHLSEDFCIVCEIHQHYPKEYLEYFMSRVSLADFQARVGLKKMVDNPAMAFYNLVAEQGLGNLVTSPIFLSELERDFIDRIQQMHHEVFIVRDLDKRRELYREFYLDYYNKLIKIK
jgi:hypothetical protein